MICHYFWIEIEYQIVLIESADRESVFITFNDNPILIKSMDINCTDAITYDKGSLLCIDKISKLVWYSHTSNSFDWEKQNKITLDG